MGFRISGLYDVKFLRDNAGTVARVDVPMAQEVAYNQETEDLEWNGDGQTLTLTTNTGLGVETTCDAYSPEFVDAMFGRTPTTTSLPTGVAKRHVVGTAASSGGVKCGMEAYCTMIDTNSGDTLWGRIYVPLGTLVEPAPPQGLSNKSTAQMVLNFSAIPSQTDAAGDAIVGVTEPVTYIIDELSAATAS